MRAHFARSSSDASDEERAKWARKAFAAIVEEEEKALPNAKPLLDHARSFAKKS